jgi:hypothetical protein
VRPVEGYPSGYGDWIRPGKQLGATRCYPATREGD